MGSPLPNMAAGKRPGDYRTEETFTGAPPASTDLWAASTTARSRVHSSGLVAGASPSSI